MINASSYRTWLREPYPWDNTDKLMADGVLGGRRLDAYQNWQWTTPSQLAAFRLKFGAKGIAMFFLFSGSDYYPSGGFYDYRGHFPSIAEAQQAFSGKPDWAHICRVGDDGDLEIVGEWLFAEQKWKLQE